MTDERDLPEGVINADPAGGFGSQHDGLADERNEAEADSPALDRSGLAVNAATVDQSATDGPKDGPSDGEVESDVPTQGLDPDMASDEQEES